MKSSRKSVFSLCAGLLVGSLWAAPQTILTFPVTNGSFYHVKVGVSGKGGTLRLGFLDADGTDVSATERALGYAVSARTAAITGDGEVVIEARAGGKTGATAAQAVLTLSEGAKARVTSASWFAGEANKDAEVAESSGFDATMHGEGNFAKNLLANPSFEEVVDGMPAHWRFSGEGEAKLISDSYAGNWAVKMSPSDHQARWVSDDFPVAPGGRIEMQFAIRYSRNAEPGEHVCPVVLEFFDAKGRMLPCAKRSAFAFTYYSSPRMANWGVMSVSPHIVPEGAVKARVAIRHRNREGIRIISWEDISVDNIAVWQTDEEVDVPFAIRGLMGAGQLLAKRKPPQMPVGKHRASSVWTVQPVTEDFGFFFAQEGKPSLEIALGNFIGYDRSLVLRGKLTGTEGEKLGDVELPIALKAYELKRVALPIAEVSKFGVYLLEYELYEGEQNVGGGSASLAWIDHRTNVSAEERQSLDYPFHVHPTGLNFLPYPHWTDDEIEANVRQAALIGAGGFRLQLRQANMSNKPEESAAQARADLANWRTRLLPLLRKYGMSGWPTFMEQGHRSYFPRSEEDSAAWKSYWREFAAGVSNDVECLIFGNEGVGGYARGFAPDEDLTKQTEFHGTIRQWVNAYRWFREAAKEANPSLDVGLSMAADLDGHFTRWLYGFAPDLQREVWAMNGYVRPWEQAANCLAAMGPERAQAYCMMPELGSEDDDKDYNARRRRTAQAQTLNFLKVKATNPRMRRMAWFIQRSSDYGRFGMFSQTYMPRPAAASYAVMTDTLGAGRIARAIDLPDGGSFYIWERMNGKRIGFGLSPKGMSVVASAKSAIHRMDVFGNPEGDVEAGVEVVLKLTEKPAYFLADGLDIPERFTISCETQSTAGDSATVSVRVTNKTPRPLALKVAAEWAAAIAVDKTSRSLALAAGETRDVPFAVKFVGTDGARVYAQPFTVRDAHGFAQGLTAELRFANREAKNMLANGDFSQDDGKGGVAAWAPDVRYSPGRPQSPVVFACKPGAGPKGGPCVSIRLGPPSTRMAELRLTQRVALKPDTRYYWSIKTRSEAGSAWWAHTEAIVRNAKGKVVSRPNFVSVDTGPVDGWMPYEGGFVSPSEPTTIDLGVLVTHAKHGEVLYAEANLVEVAAD